MISKFIAFFFICYVATARAEQSLNDHINDAHMMLKNLSAAFNSAVQNIPDQTKNVEDIQHKTQELGDEIKNFAEKVKNEFAAKVDGQEWTKNIQEIGTKLQEAATKLKEDPEIHERLSTLQAKVNEGYQIVIEQAQKLQESVQPEADAIKRDVQVATSAIINKLTEFGENFKQNLEQQINNANAQQ